jgi:1-acyl-sn-glycerol-3-phosphate acyltransferase
MILDTVRSASRYSLNLLFAMFTYLEVEGIENIPKEGAALLVANHLAVMDAPLIFMLVDRKDLSALVGKSHQRNPFYRLVTMIGGGIWIDRRAVDLSALREARDFLRAGGLLGIAPEGTRSVTGALQRAKTGAAYLANMVGGVPLVPIAIAGTEKLFKTLARLQKPVISIRIGEPFSLPIPNREERATAMERNTEEIMCRIAVMLPPEYRGVYSERQRLKELLAETEYHP